jgi:hypothetical protein
MEEIPTKVRNDSKSTRSYWMDIAGAKALKDRLGPNGLDDAPPVSVDVPEDAPPVYHWVGVTNVPARPASADADEVRD